MKTLTKWAQNRGSEDSMKRLALRCMCELLKNHYQFNLADTLSKAIIPFALSS